MKLKKFLILMLCGIIVFNTITVNYGKANKVHAVAAAIPAALIGWDIMGSLFVTVLAYCCYDSLTDSNLDYIDLNYDPSSGATREEFVNQVYGPHLEKSEEDYLHLLENLYYTGSLDESPDLCKFVEAYINRSDTDNVVEIIEEYFGSPIVNGEDESYGTTLGEAALMSYKVSDGSVGLFLSPTAMKKLYSDFFDAIKRYVVLEPTVATNESILDEYLASATDYSNYIETHYNREAYGSVKVPPVPDITDDVNVNQEYIVFRVEYDTYDRAWIWCLTWAEPEGYSMTDYLKPGYFIGGNVNGLHPSIFFDTCGTRYPHPSGLHIRDIFANGVNFDTYGLVEGQWQKFFDFETSGSGSGTYYDYDSLYDYFDYQYLLYTSVSLPITLRTGSDTYVEVENFHPVFEVGANRLINDTLSTVTVFNNALENVYDTLSYSLVTVDVGKTVVDTVNDIMVETLVNEEAADVVIPTVIDIDKTITAEQELDIDKVSTLPITDAIENVTTVTPTLPEGGSYTDFVLDDGLLSKFPFCIPYDLISTVKLLAADPVVPRWEIPFKFERLGIDETIVIDLSAFETVAAICRWCETIAFIIFLVIMTKRLIS